MADSKPPKLTLSDDKAASVRIWRRKFNAWCLLQRSWRDPSKNPTSPEHWIKDKAQCEIAAFYLALPDDVLNIFDTTILEKLTQEETSQPWVYQLRLEEHFVGQDDVMPQRLAFFNCTQKPAESVTDFETRIRSTARKTKYAEMTNPLQELMRDRLCTGVHNKDLRELLLHHYKEDGKTPYTFEEQLARAKSWEAAHNTNITIMHSATSQVEEQVNRLTNKPSLPQAKCRWCGGARHPRKDCPATKPGTFCTNCYMMENHLAKVCRSSKDKFKAEFERSHKKSNRRPPPKRGSDVHQFTADTCLSDDDDDDYVVHSFSVFAHHHHSDSPKDDKYFTWLPVSISPNRSVKVLMQVDSAATCNTLPSSIYSKISDAAPLKPSRAKIFPYSGKAIHPVGRVSLACEGVTHFETLEFEVIDTKDIPGKPALISGKDSERLGLITFHRNRVFSSTTMDIKPKETHVHMATSRHLNTQQPFPTADLQPGLLQKDELISVYKDNFTGLGTVGQPVSLTLDPSVTPRHAGVHRIPVAKLEKVKEKLDDMVTSGKLTKVDEPTSWCSNMTVQEKVLPDGNTKVRLCLDPSQTLNKAIVIPHYQIPTIQEILPRLSGKKYKTFSIFDALDGFTQIALTDESSLLTTMHTPWGRYRWLRLPYGISSAPEEFQLRMHEALEGLQDVYCIADDILVVGQGETREEANKQHDLNVFALMKRAQERNLKFNPQKIQFKLPKITFMGHVISDQGVEPDSSKVKAINDMPAPVDKQGVMRFCGMVNYLNTFCPHLSQTIRPLFELTKKDHEFIWSETHQSAFLAAKQLIARAPCLAYFDHTRPVTLQVDASQGGLGAALWQPNDSGDLQPVAYTSCKMRPNEEMWAQIEKECLAIVSACDKWDLWIYGRQVNVHTDHQPLETIFKKPLHAAPRRLQKMMMRLQRYNIKVSYKKGTSLLLADTLSRAPLPTTNDSKQTNFEVFRTDIDNHPENPRISSQTLADIKASTANDPTMCTLNKIIINGWPSQKSQLPKSLQPFWTYRDELTSQDGIIYKGQQVVIPLAKRNYMLQKAHVAHFGPESNTRLCKDITFWPGMQSDIRNACQSCGKCAQFQAQNSKEPMKSQPIPQYPWQFVSQDLCMFESHTYLVTVDHYSDFIEVDEVENTLSSTIVAKAEAHIARHGVPEAILSDNGSQFIASEFKAFCEKYQIQHITSSPYWPKGNGKAEAAVKIVKRILKKSGKCNLQEALLTYRNTPLEGHFLSPAQRSMGRRTRGLLPVSRELLLPSDNTAQAVQESIASKSAKAKQYYDATASSTLPSLTIGDFVYAKPSPHHKSGPWLYGLVTAVPAPRSYIIETPTGLTRRNRRHLRPAAPPPPEALIPRSWLKQLSANTPPPAVNPSEQTKPVPPSSTLKGSKPNTPAKPTQPSPTDTPSAPMPTSSPNVPQGKSNPLELVSHPRTGLNTHLPLKEGIVTKTRSGRVSKPAARLDL